MNEIICDIYFLDEKYCYIRVKETRESWLNCIETYVQKFSNLTDTYLGTYRNRNEDGETVSIGTEQVDEGVLEFRLTIPRQGEQGQGHADHVEEDHRRGRGHCKCQFRTVS